MESDLPTSKLSRGKVVGKALLKIGAKKSRQMITGSDKKSNHEEIADIIFDALGELKGVSVKIAQQVALGMPFLPAEYLEKINRSFNNIPSINKALIRKIIKSELGGYPQDIFDSFEMEAFAAASLGQVHRANKGSDKLAVKVQYPGIKKSIDSDMSLIHFALKRFAKGQNVDHIITEIEERLYEETDYMLEADNVMFFAPHIQDDRIVIPKVYPELSSSKVITTEMLNGVGIDEYMRSNPSQQERDAYTQMIFDGFFESLYHLNRIHADPNPGNFLFMDDGRLGLIDFGCVKKVEDDFLRLYNSLHLSLLDGDDDGEIVEQYVSLGMIEPGSKDEMMKFYHEVIKPLDSLYKEPLVEGSYDFSVHNDFSMRGFEMIFEVQKKQFHSVHKLNEQFLLINRTLMGYYALFEKMGARIETSRVRYIMHQYLSR